MLRAGDGEYSGAKTRSMSAAYCNAIFASLLAKYWLGTTAPSGISWSGQGLFMRVSISTIGWCLSAHCGDSSCMIATFRDKPQRIMEPSVASLTTSTQHRIALIYLPFPIFLLAHRQNRT